MKYLILTSSFLFLFANLHSQPNEIKPTNVPLLNSIDWFINSTKNLTDSISTEHEIKGLISINFYKTGLDQFSIKKSEVPNTSEVYFDKIECEYEISFTITDVNYFDLFPPSFYFIYKNKLVAIYTGIERLFMKEDLKGFKKKTSKYLSMGTAHFSLPSYRILIDQNKSEDFKVILTNKESR